MLVHKGVPNGYAPIDLNRRLLPANVTPGAGLGTVSEVLFSFPSHFSDLAPSAGATVSYNLTWKNAPNNSWFGVYGVGITPLPEPQFQTAHIPYELIPEISANKFTSGVFDPDVLPVAVGMGPDHAIGMIPDPGETGDPDEYLGRDMEYHHFSSGQPYQPFVPDPTITLLSVTGDRATVTVRSALEGSYLFYRVGGGNFTEAPPSGPDIILTVVPSVPH
jgi:hypothetical protein